MARHTVTSCTWLSAVVTQFARHKLSKSQEAAVLCEQECVCAKVATAHGDRAEEATPAALDREVEPGAGRPRTIPDCGDPARDVVRLVPVPMPDVRHDNGPVLQRPLRMHEPSCIVDGVVETLQRCSSPPPALASLTRGRLASRATARLEPVPKQSLVEQMKLEAASHCVLEHPGPLGSHGTDVEVHHARVERFGEGLRAHREVTHAMESPGYVKVGCEEDIGVRVEHALRVEASRAQLGPHRIDDAWDVEPPKRRKVEVPLAAARELRLRDRVVERQSVRQHACSQ
eukprot:3182587-Prymnesium_polylepis.1